MANKTVIKTGELITKRRKPGSKKGETHVNGLDKMRDRHAAARKKLSVVMDEAHPIYGVFGRAFEAVGGEPALADWAEQNPTDFYRIFSKMVPRDHTQPEAQINIQINNQLGPTTLDD
jgi:hypothetical protein